MHTLSIINYKGGVGKTVLAANIAAEIAWSRQKKVLLIDLDPQASLTFSIVPVNIWRTQLEASRTIKTWYDRFLDVGRESSIGQLIHSPLNVHFDNGGEVDLIASHLGLINVDLELATKLAGASFRQIALNYLRVHSRLTHGLNDPEVQGKYDLVIIDCPPNFNIVTKTALVASDAYLVPAKPDYLSTLGIDQLNRHVTQLSDDYNRFCTEFGGDDFRPMDCRMLGIVFTMVKFYSQQPIQDQREHIAAVRRLQFPLLESMIRENNRFYSRRTDGTSPLVIQHTSEAGFLEVRTELEQLASEVEGLLAAL